MSLVDAGGRGIYLRVEEVGEIREDWAEKAVLVCIVDVGFAETGGVGDIVVEWVEEGENYAYYGLNPFGRGWRRRTAVGGAGGRLGETGWKRRIGLGEGGWWKSWWYGWSCG